MTSEEWRAIPGFPDYEVSSLGRVRSYKKSGPPRLLIGSAAHGGYRKVLLTRDRKYVNRNLHVLVCEAFHGPRQPGQVVRHLDGQQLNNAASNLTWGTASENARDRIRHGTDRESRKTECLNGHPFVAANTYITPAGSRRCRTCHRRRDAESKTRRAFRAAGIPA